MDLPWASHLPMDHRASAVYRVGGALVGIVLLVFGIASLTASSTFSGVSGDIVLGLETNRLLGILSVVMGLLLLGGAVVGGNLASNLNTVVAAVFLLAGLASLCVLRTSVNIFGFGMPNVIFSFAVGLLLATFGLYGRVSGGLPASGSGHGDPLDLTARAADADRGA
jgi:hypothetical protein